MYKLYRVGKQLVEVEVMLRCYAHLGLAINFSFSLGITLTNMNWLLGRNSKLSTSNKLLIYKTILKPIWTYGIQVWGTASNSNIEILELFQSKALRMIVDASWHVPNMVIGRDLQIPTVDL
jgi:hypothetical protein